MGLISEQLLRSVLLTLFGTICILTAIIFLVSIIGTKNLVLNQKEIKYFTSYYKKNIMLKKIGRDNIGLIKNSINSEEKSIAVLTKLGLDIIRKVSDKIDNRELSIDMVSKIFSLKDEVILINTASLTIQEKFYIETAIYYGL